ncbi:MAG TPA: gamma carbonic anhydrase family protein, partial [Flavobacteriaceae bacterium]|nr:gamma carbonic anhydrase family protein [Flavobacteriaceae bacterium]
KKIKDISEELLSGEVERIADAYIKYASWYK